MNHRIIALAGVFVMASTFPFVAPASAQVEGSTLSAEGECSPDGLTQVVVVTLINGDGATATIDFADAEGTAFGDEDLHDLTFSPTSVPDQTTSTASISFPGTASGTIDVEVSLSFDEQKDNLVSDSFTLQACPVVVTTTVAPTTTATAKAAAATAARPAFTG